MIGTGASAVQVVPTIAPDVAHLEVYQRTPIWVGPRDDHPIHSEDRVSFAYSRLGRRLRRSLTQLGFQIGTYLVVTYQKRRGIMKRAEKAWADYTRRSVADSSLHDKLIPKYGLGCKRPAVSNEYLQSFNRDNVSLVTERGNLPRFPVHGRDGVELGAYWEKNGCRHTAGSPCPDSRTTS